MHSCSFVQAITSHPSYFIGQLHLLITYSWRFILLFLLRQLMQKLLWRPLWLLRPFVFVPVADAQSHHLHLHPPNHPAIIYDLPWKLVSSPRKFPRIPIEWFRHKQTRVIGLKSLATNSRFSSVKYIYLPQIHHPLRVIPIHFSGPQSSLLPWYPSLW